MKAVRIHDYGAADVLVYEDAPRPKPGEGEVLIRVHATTVNPFDCAVRAGYMSAYFDYSLPLIPGPMYRVSSRRWGKVSRVSRSGTRFMPGAA